MRVTIGMNIPRIGYAPTSACPRTRRPVNVPSRVAPSSTSCTCARPCVMPSRFSRRVSVQRTARPTLCARPAIMSCSGYTPPLAPKPPPIHGARTRTCVASSPSTRATSACTPKTDCVDAHTVSDPSASGTATQPFASMVTGATRWCFTLTRTTTSASAKKSSSGSAATAPTRFVPCAGKRSGAPSAAAATGSATTGSGSTSTVTCSAASTACARVSASTTATASPTKRTRSVASNGRPSASSPVNARWWGRSRSAAVQTECTPSPSAAAAVCTVPTRPWATWDRTNTACSAPSTSRSAMNRAPPVSRPGSSERRIEWPRTVRVTAASRSRQGR